MNKQEETSRRFSTTPPRFYCGIDVHARSMDGCIVHHDGERLLHRHMQAAPEPFLQALTPYREGLVVAVECLFPWYGRAARWAAQGIPCVLGPALSMTALHGGTAKNDPNDSHKMAALRRGGMLPNASVSPAQRRAPRDVRRRRPPLRRKRAERLAHVHHTNRQYPLPERGKNIADTANREGGAERFEDRAVHKPIAVARALLPYDAERLKDRELFILQTATPPEPQTLSLRHTVPGIGTMLRLGWRYDIYRLDRFPSGQEFASYARLGTCRKASGGTRVGTSGKKIGPAPLTGAVSEAAPLCVRTNPQGQKLLARVEKKQETGTALSILAHTRGRAVSCMLTRQGACAMERCLQPCGSRAGAPSASLDSAGMSLSRACSKPALATAVNATAHRGRGSLRPRDCWDTRPGA